MRKHTYIITYICTGMYTRQTKLCGHLQVQCMQLHNVAQNLEIPPHTDKENAIGAFIHITLYVHLQTQAVPGLIHTLPALLQDLLKGETIIIDQPHGIGNIIYLVPGGT